MDQRVKGKVKVWGQTDLKQYTNDCLIRGIKKQAQLCHKLANNQN